MPAKIQKLHRLFQGDWYLSFPREEIKRLKSACPYWADIWQRSDVAPRHCGGQPKKITLSAWNASKLFAGLRPLGRVPTHLSLCQITFGPRRMGAGAGLSHYSIWQLVVSLRWGRNDDSNSPSSPTNSAHMGTCVIITTTETNSHGFVLWHTQQCSTICR